MSKERSFYSSPEFGIVFELAGHLLDERELESLKNAEAEFNKRKLEKAKQNEGCISPNEIYDIWLKTLDDIPQAKEALHTKLGKALLLWNARQVKSQTVH